MITSTVGAYPANTTITSVGAGGTTATTSAAPTTPGALTDLVITRSVPVTNGTYTMTVVNNGALGANVAVATAGTFRQSIVSSGSTFTVAEF